MIFFVGLHIPAQAHRFASCMVSVNVLRRRRADFAVRDWLLDSGAFTEVVRHGGYRTPPEEYAAQVRRWSACGTLLAAVSRDWMCEPVALAATGLTVATHQALTLDSYRELRGLLPGVPLMPVLQGATAADYAAHAPAYGDLLAPGAWVGVGSVCKRQGSPASLLAVLEAINDERPGLRLHGFGVKTTALAHPRVRALLWSADSMAWSYAARRTGGDANGWQEAEVFRARVAALGNGPRQRGLFDREVPDAEDG